MPLGIVSEEDWQIENNGKRNLDITTLEHGRGKDNNNVPQELREVIAEEIVVNGNTEKVAKVFNISKQSAQSYANGSTSLATYHDNDKVTARKRVAGRIQNKLLEALNELTGDKIKESKAKDISGIVKDMAIVHEKLNGKVLGEDERGPQVHVHLFAPKVKSLKDSEIIDIDVVDIK